MRGLNGVKAFLVVAIIGFLAYVTVAGLNIPAMDINFNKATDNMRYGIDIKGGVRAVLEAPEGITPTEKEIETAKAIITTRLDQQGVFDKTLTSDKATGRIILELPWKENDEKKDPQAVIDDLSATALLTFREVDENQKDANGDYLPLEDKIILQGDDILDASPILNERGTSDVSLKFSKEASKKFEEATGRLIGKPIAIFLDEKLISYPTVDQKISGTDGARITLNIADPEAAAAQAKLLSDKIRAGSLPFKLEDKEVSYISATMGKSALDVTIRAFVWALLFVALFMILFYRLPGLIASITLLGHISALVLFMAVSDFTLTLPGIAGIILTVGMSVDANVIIFERIKEEIRSGKTVQAAIDVGFKRGFAAVFDGNLTTLLAAAVLYIFGTGTIKSFSITLSAGVILNFLSAIFASRVLLKAISGVKAFKKHWLFGVKGGAANV